MSKIVQAVNAMITNIELVTDVRRGRAEVFFRYKDKYTWSMKRDGGDHFLYFYPDAGIEELLAREAHGDWEGLDMVVYKDVEIGTKEAKASFSELYTLLKEREFGVNAVLDDIISDADPF